MQGLLDQLTGFIKTPEGQGLLAGAFGYAANARKGTPINNLGRGGVAGLLGYANAMDRQDQQAENQFQRSYRQMQMDEMQRKVAEQRGQQEWRAGLPAILQKQTMVPNDAGPTAAPDTEAINKYLLDPRSPFADKVIERQLFPKEEEAYTLGEGQVRYKGTQVVAQGPAKKEDKPTDQRLYEYAVAQGFKGSLFDFKRELARAGASKTTVNNINPFESEQSKTYGKGVGEWRTEIQKSGFNAPNTLANLARMEQLLQGVDGGRYAPAGKELASAAKSVFGIELDPNLGNKEAAEALAVEMALAQRPVGSGPMTDKDFLNFMNTVPGLSKTAEGRRQITATLRKKAERDVQVARMAREYAKQNGGSLDDNFLDVVAEFYANNPLFTPESVMRQPQPAQNGWAIREVK